MCLLHLFVGYKSETAERNEYIIVPNINDGSEQQQQKHNANKFKNKHAWTDVNRLLNTKHTNFEQCHTATEESSIHEYFEYVGDGPPPSTAMIPMEIALRTVITWYGSIDQCKCS